MLIGYLDPEGLGFGFKGLSSVTACFILCSAVLGAFGPTARFLGPLGRSFGLHVQGS